MDTVKILVIPDIHGRDFWKGIDPTKYYKVIFLGDYLDSYNLSSQVQKDNLYKIYELWKKHKNVICLIGNHELSYLIPNYRCSGYDPANNVPEVLAIIRQFKVAYQISNYLFTHAGVSKEWLEKATEVNEQGRYFEVIRGNEKTINYLSDRVDYFLETMYEEKYHELFRIDGLRLWGGRGRKVHGGPLWLDKIHLENSILPNYHQIVGHTRIDSVERIGDDTSSVTFIDLGDSSSVYEISIDIDNKQINYLFNLKKRL